METLGYYNGEIGTLERMKVPMCDRVCFFGDGVYDATYTRNHLPFALKEHVARFYRSAAKVGIVPQMPQNALEELLRSLVKEVESGEQFLYFQLTRGTEIRDHLPSEGLKPNLWVTIKPASIRPLDSLFRLIGVPDRRRLDCDVKSLNLLPNVLASIEAHKAGADEAVFFRNGVVTECAHSNVHILKGGKLITAPADEKILAGVCRARLLALASRLGVETEERAYGRAEMEEADEVLVSSAGTFAVRAIALDGKEIGGGDEKLAKRLQRGLFEEFSDETGGGR